MVPGREGRIAHLPVEDIERKNKARDPMDLALLYGSPAWARTRDKAVNSRLLYQLSYRGMNEDKPLRSWRRNGMCILA